MQLKNKALSITLASWLGLFSIILFTSELYLKTEFYHLEQQFTRRGITRIQHFFSEEQQNLQKIAESWAHWDTSYQFAQNPSSQFKDKHLTTRVLERYGLNAAFIFNKNKQLIFHNSTNHPLQKNRLKKELFERLTDKTTTGFLKLDDSLYLVSQVPLLNSDKKGPIQGYLVLTKLVTPTLIDRLTQVTLSPTTLHLHFQQDNISKQATISQQLQQNNYLEQKEHRHLIAYTGLFDLSGPPLAVIKVTTPAYITEQGYKVIHYYLFFIILLGLCLGFTVMWLIKSQVVDRILSLSQQVIQIGLNRNYNQRIAVKGQDELKQAATCINDLLATIEEAQEQRTFQQTQPLRELNRQLRQEISIRKEAEVQLLASKDQLHHLAHHDGLTDLPNRSFFDEVLHKAILKAQRQQEELAILFVDLDRFKHINDAFGHHLGDTVLKVVSTRFQNNLRISDTIARQGGDEFIILLESFSKHEDIYRVAEKLLASLRQPIETTHHTFVISASLGVSIYPNDGESMEELTRKADMAMYRSKYSGGNSVHFYTEQMNKEAHERMKLEATLRHAVDNQEFISYYQPKLCLKTNKIIGAEALLRHTKYDNKSAPASNFIKLAEETGLIGTISQQILTCTCQDMLNWSHAGFDTIALSVNISAIEFRDSNFVSNFLKIIEKHNISPHRIGAELTESALVYDIKGAVNKLTELKKSGIKIIVDDFETGYSSLSYLKEFPVDELKIDKSFVDGLPHNRWDVAIVKAIVTLAKNLNLKVVAEGISNQEQFLFLKEEGCDALQGHFISKALSSKDILHFLARYGKD